MKYIIFDSPSGIEEPVIFSELQAHSDMVRCVHSRFPGLNVVAAGFCRFVVDKDYHVVVSCWGKSVTLGVSSRSEDSELLARVNEFRG